MANSVTLPFMDKNLDAALRSAEASENILRKLVGRGSYDKRPIIFAPPEKQKPTEKSSDWLPELPPRERISPLISSNDTFDIKTEDPAVVRASEAEAAEYASTSAPVKVSEELERIAAARSARVSRQLSALVGRTMVGFIATWLVGLMAGVMAESVIVGIVTALIFSCCVLVAFKAKATEIESS